MGTDFAYAVYEVGMDYGSNASLRAVYTHLELAVSRPETWYIKVFTLNRDQKVSNTRLSAEVERVRQIMSAPLEMRVKLARISETVESEPVKQ